MPRSIAQLPTLSPKESLILELLVLVSRLDGVPPAAGGLPRRIYATTVLGREVLGAWTTAASRFRVRFVG